ncbi:MAG: integration host factor subunit alpha [Deltaproteobacteria bacterium]|nr:integration host factor subunit alpha [Deltaproteobacteria bacterium]MBW2117346.1 integration host factor subunit alpha [Deltaproteobacteria bacterium]MBW2343783.1 integration host factor subunit alpha [Deltaproteobacteria bacterium]
MTLTKHKLTDSIHKKIDFPKVRCERLVGFLFEIIKDTLENGEDVLISGFGKLCVKDKKKRRGRNPVSGEELTLDSRRLVTFKCSTVLKGKLNGGRK